LVKADVFRFQAELFDGSKVHIQLLLQQFQATVLTPPNFNQTNFHTMATQFFRPAHSFFLFACLAFFLSCEKDDSPATETPDNTPPEVTVNKPTESEIQDGAIQIYLNLEDQKLKGLYFKVTRDSDEKILVEQTQEFVQVENISVGWVTDTFLTVIPPTPVTLFVEVTDSSDNKTVRTVKFIHRAN